MTEPTCPYDLGAAGSAWWSWAWSTPQAERWDAGALYTAARRALLEDDRACLTLAGDEFLLADLLEGADGDGLRKVTYALERLAASATKATALSREMRELETQLGLGPKAWQSLGGKQDEKPKGGNTVDEFTKRRAARRARAAGAEG